MAIKLDKSKLQRDTDAYVVHAREFSSRGVSFIIVLLGVILQSSHTTLLMYNVSAFENNILRVIVSLGIGLFISCALAIFTLKHDGKSYHIEQLINIFFYFEVFTNLFYYFSSIILSKWTVDTGFGNIPLQSWVAFAASLPFAYIMPYAIKQFAGVIHADAPIQMGTIDVMPDDVSMPQSAEVTQKLEADIENVKMSVETLRKELLSLPVKDSIIGKRVKLLTDSGKEAVVTISYATKQDEQTENTLLT